MSRKFLNLERRGMRHGFKIHGRTLSKEEARIYGWAYQWGFWAGWTYGSERMLKMKEAK